MHFSNQQSSNSNSNFSHNYELLDVTDKTPNNSSSFYNHNSSGIMAEMNNGYTSVPQADTNGEALAQYTNPVMDCERGAGNGAISDKNEDDALLAGNTIGTVTKRRGSSIFNEDEKSGALTRPRFYKAMFGSFTCWQWFYFCSCLIFTCFVICFAGQRHPGFDAASREILYTVTFLTMIFLFPEGRGSADSNTSAKKDDKPAPPQKSTTGAFGEKPVVKGVPLPNNVSSSTAVSTAKRVAAGKPRLLYLDNLKTLLTFVLISYHIAVAHGAAGWVPYSFGLGNFKGNYLGTVLSIFTFANQSYFMCLFFFVSGYFTPSSLTRKGTRAFLKDKFMRFGIPLIGTSFIIFPLTIYLVMQAAFGTDWSIGAKNDPSQLLSAGAPWQLWYIIGPGGGLWFVMVLLLFNLAFCVIYPNGINSLPSGIPLPNFVESIAIGSVVGFIQGWILKYKFFRMWEVPNLIGGGGLPFEMMFFFAGALAKKNDWLEQVLAMSASDAPGADSQAWDSLSPSAVSNKKNEKRRNLREIWLFRMHTLVMVAVIAVFCVLTEANQSPFHRNCAPIKPAMEKKYPKKKFPWFHEAAFPTPPVSSTDATAAAVSADTASATPKKDTTSTDTASAGKKEEPSFFQTLFLDFNGLFWHIFRGQLTMTFAFVTLQFFSQYCNKDLPACCKKLFSEAAYGAFVFHGLLWQLVLWAFLSWIFPSMNAKLGDGAVNLQFGLCSDMTIGSSTEIPQGILVFSFLWTVVITNLILWPGVFMLRKIPGVDQVL